MNVSQLWPVMYSLTKVNGSLKGKGDVYFTVEGKGYSLAKGVVH